MCDRFTIRPNLNECRYRATLEISKVAKWERDHTHRLVLDAARGNVDPQEVPILLDVKAKAPPQPPPPPPPPSPSPSPSPKPKGKKLFFGIYFFLKKYIICSQHPLRPRLQRLEAKERRRRRESK